MINFPYKGNFMITQTFLNPSSRYSSGYHFGVDLVGLKDKKIYAIQDGTVVFSDFDSGFGNTVIVRQDDGLYCRYSHLEVLNVSNGTNVASGVTIIGIEGKTGNVVGGDDPRHLDLRISRVPHHSDEAEVYRNPCEYLGIPNLVYHEVIPGGSIMTKINNVILCKNEIDKRAAQYLADHLRCNIIEMNFLPPSVLDQLFENIFVIGTSEKPVAKAINIYGLDRYDTCQKVIDMIKDARRQSLY